MRDNFPTTTYEYGQQALADMYTDATHQPKRARVTDPAAIDLFSVTKKAVKAAL